MASSYNEESDFKLETTHHSILWRPFDTLGSINYDKLKGKNEKIYFSDTKVDEFPGIKVNVTVN